MIDKILLAMADEYERNKEEFSMRVVELLNDEWSPHKYDNFWSAMMDSQYEKHEEAIAFALKHKDFTELGRLMFKACEDYCINCAEDQAAYEINGGLL